MIERSHVHPHHSRHMVLRHGSQLSLAPITRECSEPSCMTVLSRYNPSETCTLHHGWRDTRQRRYD